MRKASLLLALTVSSGAAYANGLEDMRAALSALQGLGTLNGAYEVKETRTNHAAKPARGAETVMAAAQVADGMGALEVRWDKGLLKRASEEASPAKGAARREGLSNLIGQTTAVRIANAVNYAPRLLQSLALARLRTERMDSYRGKPARLIEVVMTPEEVPNDAIAIKDNTIVAQYWLGPDNLPLAAVTNHVIDAKFMVFMTYNRSVREEHSFGVLANRLVLLKREAAGKEKGPGIDNEFSNVYTFTPKL